MKKNEDLYQNGPDWETLYRLLEERMLALHVEALRLLLHAGDDAALLEKLQRLLLQNGEPV